jgi:hypothetical protein
LDDDGDDGTVFLIDYGITKKVENAELLQKIDQFKQYAATPVMNRQNTFQDEQRDDFLLDKNGVAAPKKKEKSFVGTFIFASIS